MTIDYGQSEFLHRVYPAITYDSDEGKPALKEIACRFQRFWSGVFDDPFDPLGFPRFALHNKGHFRPLCC
jgi:hypothetical protein